MTFANRPLGRPHLSGLHRFMTRRVVLLLVAMLLVTLIAAYRLRTVPTDRSLIDDLSSGRVKTADIQRVSLLRFDPRNGWPFSEDDYSRLEWTQIESVDAVGRLLAILRQSSMPGREHRNHPSVLYYGILRIDLVSGGGYYAHYAVYQHDGVVHAQINANSLNGVNPNKGREYENLPLAQFLREQDPSYPKAGVSAQR